MGKIFAVMMVKNEGDIIQYTIQHLFSQGLDGIIVRDNGSSDETLTKLKCLAKHYGEDILIIERDFTFPFYQGKKLNEMAKRAHDDYGAEWVMIVDADELFYSGDSSMTISDLLRSVDKDIEVIGCPMWNHYCTPGDKHAEINPYKRMVYRHVDRNPLDKCIIRYSHDLVIDEGNHRILRNGNPVPGAANGIGIRHFSARDCEQWIKKSIANADALAAADAIPYEIGAHCRRYKEIYDSKGANALRHVFFTFFYYDLPNDKVVLSPAPYTGG